MVRFTLWTLAVSVAAGLGWIAAISMLILGGASVAWHLATGGGLRRPYPGDTWTSAEPVMAAPA